MKQIDFEQLALPGVRGLVPYQPGKPEEELARELGLTSIVKLASNENPLGAGEAAREAVAASVGSLHRYPDGSCHVLKEALSARLGVAPGQLTLGNGSNEILELVARTFVAPEHEVVFSAHAFAVYPLVTRAVGARAVEVPARDWGHDLEAMAAAVTSRTRLIFVANPNNPTGTWVDRVRLEAFLERVPPEVLVVLDEAYFEYVTEAEYPDGITLLPRHRNLLVTRTFSKIHGLAALRLGYGVSDPSLAELLNRVRQPFNVNAPAQAAGLAALGDTAHVARSVALNREGLVQLREGVEALGLSVIPSVGNFLCVDFGRDAMPIYRGLLQRGVIVRPVAGYGMPTFLRVTVGLPEENRRFLEALADVLQTEHAA
ncbi:MAG: histidinol-phosphate transaminase [Gammaproteobacteria bacterium]|nr:MAG: histidinol-phosphate transaminase [Gammaproteobacteria bacterium]